MKDFFRKCPFNFSSLSLFRPGGGGYWGPSQLWIFVTSKQLKLETPDWATYPKIVLATIWNLRHSITNIGFVKATIFRQLCFANFAFWVFWPTFFRFIMAFRIFPFNFKMLHHIRQYYDLSWILIKKFHNPSWRTKSLSPDHFSVI